jgi:hypothetical protein
LQFTDNRGMREQVHVLVLLCAISAALSEETTTTASGQTSTTTIATTTALLACPKDKLVGNWVGSCSARYGKGSDDGAVCSEAACHQPYRQGPAMIIFSCFVLYIHALTFMH